MIINSQLLLSMRLFVDEVRESTFEDIIRLRHNATVRINICIIISYQHHIYRDGGTFKSLILSVFLNLFLYFYRFFFFFPFISRPCLSNA